MANFPGSTPSFAGFTSSHTLAEDNHAAQHNLEQGEIVALATKIGTGSSTPTANTVLRGTGAGTSAFGQVDLTTDVTGILPFNKGGLGTDTASEARTTLGVNTALETLALAYPVGSIYINADVSTNPGTLLGFGTWAAFGAGRVLVGIDGTQTEFDSAGETGGAKVHTLDITEIPAHTHTYTRYSATTSNTAGASTNTWNEFSTPNTGSAGGGGSHNNLQPYIVVYMWRRTA